MLQRAELQAQGGGGGEKMHGTNGHQPTATELVKAAKVNAKKCKKKKRQRHSEEERRLSTASSSASSVSSSASSWAPSSSSSPGGSSVGSLASGSMPGSGGDEDGALAEARFKLSFENVSNFPQRPGLRWVLEALGTVLLPSLKPAKVEIEEEVEDDADTLRLAARRAKASGGTPKNEVAWMDVVARRRFEQAVLWSLATKRRKTKNGLAKAATEIAVCWREHKAKQRRVACAVVLQRWYRARALRKEAVMWRKRQERKARGKARKARLKAELAARQGAGGGWTLAQKGILVALDLAYGEPVHRRDWALRARFIGRPEDMSLEDNTGQEEEEEDDERGDNDAGGSSNMGGGGGGGRGGGKFGGGGGGGSFGDSSSGGKTTDFEKLTALRALVPGDPQSMKNIM